MGILTLCKEFEKLKKSIEIAEIKLNEKLNDWEITTGSMANKINQLPFIGD